MALLLSRIAHGVDTLADRPLHTPDMRIHGLLLSTAPELGIP